MIRFFARPGLVMTILLLAGCGGVEQTPPSVHTAIALPSPVHEGEMSVEQALLERRSVRTYSDEPLTLAEISQLLWAAQGVTHPSGFRTAPSAGGLYPLEILLLAVAVTDLAHGIYRYEPDGRELLLIVEGDHRQELSHAALDQTAILEAPAVIVIAAVYERTKVKYGERGVQYVHIEAGCASENIYLQAVSLDLGTVFIGAFHDEEVREVLQLEADEQPLGIMPVGREQVP
ncbi:MAG: SagB/ThcOx family dehydrogenase [Chloroflexota bacterium]